MNWKTVCALALCITPIAYCTAVDEASRRTVNAALAETCIGLGRVWTQSRGGYCYPEGDKP